MTRVILILFFSFCSTLNISAQEKHELEKHLQPIIEGVAGPSVIILKPIYIINDLVVRDSIKIEKFRKKYSSEIAKSDYYNKSEALKKYGIKHEDGVLVIRTRRKKIIDLN